MYRIEGLVGTVRVTARRGKKQWAYVLEDAAGGEVAASPYYYRSATRAVWAGVYEHAARPEGTWRAVMPPTPFTIILSGVLGAEV